MKRQADAERGRGRGERVDIGSGAQEPRVTEIDLVLVTGRQESDPPGDY